ncbi:hypothetical protein GCM10010840_05780 [Deinococcus aerolatus]|uniref:Uncharacterized protein n=1 Tax=Deinococcus aerolatus TaxID=522487 RepID=A0ABQ2G1E4_9DEIO|nr:hypothetical protein GCM10010840_05780 [Deinococcus aerolatus]
MGCCGTGERWGDEAARPQARCRISWPSAQRQQTAAVCSAAERGGGVFGGPSSMQCFSVLGQIQVLGEAYRRTIGFMWLNLGVAGLAFIGGVIYLWFQIRKGRQA